MTRLGDGGGRLSVGISRRRGVGFGFLNVAAIQSVGPDQTSLRSEVNKRKISNQEEFLLLNCADEGLWTTPYKILS